MRISCSLSSQQVAVQTLTCDKWAENTYVVSSPDSHSAVVVDPGIQWEDVLRIVSEQQLSVAAILLTHGHYDHICGAAPLQSRLGVPVYLNAADSVLLRSVNTYAFAWKLPKVQVPEITFPFHGDADLSFPDLDVHAVHLPGHTEGSTVYACAGHAFIGDVLFPPSKRAGATREHNLQWAAEAEGRLRNRLGKSSMLYPGHGRSKSR